MSKPKYCEVGEHMVDKLWYAKTKSRPSCCKACLPRFKSEAQSNDNVKNNTKYRSAQKSSQIKPISAKKEKELVKYRKLRDEYMKSHTICEANGPDCTIKATDLHHVMPRAYYLCDVSVFKALCRNCHNRCESDHAWARENKLKIDHLGDRK